MDYTLRKPARRRGRVRIVPPRPSLRRGGGRRDAPGWTEHKRRTNRRRFDALRPFLRSGVTIAFPFDATPAALISANDSLREFFKCRQIPARAVWEGPSPHVHLALGIPHEAATETALRRRMAKRWPDWFDELMRPNAIKWDAREKPDRLASYLGKTRHRDGTVAKDSFAWLQFPPAWEVNRAGWQVYEYSSEKEGKTDATPAAETAVPAAPAATSETDAKTPAIGLARRHAHTRKPEPPRLTIMRGWLARVARGPPKDSAPHTPSRRPAFRSAPDRGRRRPLLPWAGWKSDARQRKCCSKAA